MITIKINCDFCNAEFEEKVKSYPQQLLQNYGALKNSAELKNWVYQSPKDLWYCPRCAEYRNVYRGKLKYKNRENLKDDWHYVEDKDFPPFTKEGVGVTVLDQDNKEVFYTKNCGWLYHDPSGVGKTYADVYKWKYEKV